MLPVHTSPLSNPYSFTPSHNHSSTPHSQKKSDNTKKKYRVLNDYERKGLAARIQELKAQFEKQRDPRAHVELLEACILELQSSYQATKDAWKTTGADLQRTQATLQTKEVQIAMIEQTRKAQIARIEKELIQAQKDVEHYRKQKREREDEVDELIKEGKWKAHKLDEAETNHKKLSSQLRIKESQLEAQHQQIKELKDELQAEGVLRATTEEELALEKKKRETMQGEMDDLNATLRELLENQYSQARKIQDAISKLNPQNAEEPTDFL